MRKNITIGKKYGPIAKITTREKAAAYFEKCVKHTMRFNTSREKAVAIERANIGYYAGYFDCETQVRINSLFLVEHPMFGKRVNEMTLEEAFLEGINFANKITGNKQ